MKIADARRLWLTDLRVFRMKTAVTVIITLLVAVGISAASSEQEMLNELLAQNKALVIKIKKAEKTREEIARSEQANAGRQRALDYAREELRHKGMAMIDEARNIERQAHNGCPWGATLPHTQKAFADACNTEGRKLNAMMEDVQKRGAGLSEYARELDREQQGLSGTTVKLAAKKSRNESELQGLYNERADWQRVYNQLVFKSSAYERLKKTAPAARICEHISEPMTDDALERAVACLNRLWDGSR